jgi:hypothetical protein
MFLILKPTGGYRMGSFNVENNQLLLTKALAEEARLPKTRFTIPIGTVTAFAERIFPDGNPLQSVFQAIGRKICWIAPCAGSTARSNSTTVLSES